MKPWPILFVGDAVSCHSGLGRILRDIAVRTDIHMRDQFRVATLGIGGAGSRKFPFFQYHIQSNPNHQLPDLPQVVDDHFGGESGIIFFVGDASRYGWLCHPEVCTFDGLRNWLLANRARHKLWLYHPLDADSINGTYPKSLLETLCHFDRVLNYTAWSAEVTGYPDHLPHGIDASIFKPHPKKQAKRMFREMGFATLKDDSLLINYVGTNQGRKGWGIAIETARVLLDQGHDVQFWAHTDDLRRHWDIPTTLQSFGLSGHNAVTLTGSFDDEQLCWLYAACDVSLQTGPEGFGFGIVESMASGTPVVHMRHAGGAEILPHHMLVDPIGFYLEGAHAWRRPVFDAKDWAAKVLEIRGEEVRLPERYDWNVLWPRWEQWLRKGIE
jgi:glycosyltransferase involved in cell wall biosynthesis